MKGQGTRWLNAMKIKADSYIRWRLPGWPGCSPVHGRPAEPEEVAADAVVDGLHPPSGNLHAPRLGQDEGVGVAEVTRGKTSLHKHLRLRWTVAAAEEKCFLNTRRDQKCPLKIVNCLLSSWGKVLTLFNLSLLIVLGHVVYKKCYYFKESDVRPVSLKVFGLGVHAGVGVMVVNLPGLAAPGVAWGGLGGPQVRAWHHVVSALLTGQQDDVRGLATTSHPGLMLTLAWKRNFAEISLQKLNSNFRVI